MHSDIDRSARAALQPLPSLCALRSWLMQAMRPIPPCMHGRKERRPLAGPRQPPCLPLRIHMPSQHSLSLHVGHYLDLQAAAGLQEPLHHHRLHVAADSSSSQATVAVLQAAGSAKERVCHHALQVAAYSSLCQNRTCSAGPAFHHHMLQTAVSSSADGHLPVSCRPRQAERQERLRHHALQIADEDFTVRHVDSPLQGQACFSGFDYTLNPYQVGLLGCFTVLATCALTAAGQWRQPGSGRQVLRTRRTAEKAETKDDVKPNHCRAAWWKRGLDAQTGSNLCMWMCGTSTVGQADSQDDALWKEGHAEESNCCMLPAILLLLPCVSQLRHPSLACASVSLWLADGEQAAAGPPARKSTFSGQLNPRQLLQPPALTRCLSVTQEQPKTRESCNAPDPARIGPPLKPPGRFHHPTDLLRGRLRRLECLMELEQELALTWRRSFLQVSAWGAAMSKQDCVASSTASGLPLTSTLQQLTGEVRPWLAVQSPVHGCGDTSEQGDGARAGSSVYTGVRVCTAPV